MNNRMKHMVIFTLMYEKGSEGETNFLNDGQKLLTQIKGVENFEVHTQISPKNEFNFGFSMEFADKATFDAYMIDPIHVAFVNDRWMVEVTDFLEIDFESYR